MADIADIRIRLLAATQPEELLTAALEAFTLALAVCHAHQDPADPRFTAFVMAAIHAAEGRDAIAFAPSLPAGCFSVKPESEHGSDGSPGSGLSARDLAELLVVLSEQLAQLGQTAMRPADRQASADGSRCARTIHQLLGSPEET
jgi:hypothetical protein